MPGHFTCEFNLDKVSLLYHAIITLIFLIILFPVGCFAKFQNKDISSNLPLLIDNSDIFLMYSKRKEVYKRKYNEDVIAWGGQLAPPYQDGISKRRKITNSSYQTGIRYHAIDLALLQEGGKFLLIEGGMSPVEANSFFYKKLRIDNKEALLDLKHLGIDLEKKSVIDIDGVPIGVPWLANRFFIPMPCIQNNSVRDWYKKQIARLMTTGANILHFDEPAGSGYALKADKPGCFCNSCMIAFSKYIKKQPKKIFNNAGIQNLSNFNYRNYIKKLAVAPKKAPLWDEFVRFQLLENYRLLIELQEYARSIVNHSLFMSLNASPANWVELPFMQLQDVMVLEAAHLSEGISVKNNSFFVYKIGDALRKPVVSTAHGNDWYQVKKGKHPFLACAWIAQAYALGHFFMIPDPAWVRDPKKGSDNYYPETDHFLCLTTWIKEVSRLLDGYKAIAKVAVIVTREAIKKDLQRIYKITTKLATENVPYEIILSNNNLAKKEIIVGSSKDYSSIIIASPRYTSRDTKKRISKAAGNRPVWMNRPAWMRILGKSFTSSIQPVIEVVGKANVLVFPRVKGNSVVIHLLNRAYRPDVKKMNIAGPFQLVINKSLFQNINFQKAVLYQPVVSANYPEGYSGRRKELRLSVNNDGIQIRIPELELWGIIELSI